VKISMLRARNCKGRKLLDGMWAFFNKGKSLLSHACSMKLKASG
jgi:hypothetical protein